MAAPNFLIVAGPDKGRSFAVHPGTGHMLGRHSEATYPIKDLRVPLPLRDSLRGRTSIRRR